MDIIKLCRICGEEFTIEPGSNPKRDICYGEHKAVCSICGKEFTPVNLNIVVRYNEGGKVTCGRSCQYKLAHSRARLKNCIICGRPFISENNKRICYNDHHYKCEVCGTDFVNNGARCGEKWFCSHMCRKISRRASDYGINVKYHEDSDVKQIDQNSEFIFG